MDKAGQLDALLIFGLCVRIVIRLNTGRTVPVITEAVFWALQLTIIPICAHEPDSGKLTLSCTSRVFRFQIAGRLAPGRGLPSCLCREVLTRAFKPGSCIEIIELCLDNRLYRLISAPSVGSESLHWARKTIAIKGMRLSMGVSSSSFFCSLPQ